MNMSHSGAGQRIWDRCQALEELSEQADGLTRVFLSKEQRAAADLVSQWMEAAGMSVRQDAIGNVVGRYEGERPEAPCLMLGSHLDTVRDAGKYDGMLGVVAAIECVHAFHRRVQRFPFAIEVIEFADEEGVRFGAALLGSRAVVGNFDMNTLDRVDRTGLSMRDALLAYGLDPQRITQAARRRRDVLAFVELHIEQGPVLESRSLPVGVVTAINGASRFTVEITGEAGHAGTVPMSQRKDAFLCAAACALAIQRRAASEADLVATVGRVEVLPGAVNVIPGTARFSLDVRSPSDAARVAACADIRREIETICAERGLAVSIAQIHEGPSVPCADWLQTQLAAAVAADGLPVHYLPSGAGHDAMAIADLTDVAMLFMRCERGISHNPAESVSIDDIEVAARTYGRFIEHFQPKQSAS